jgi:hypothetical protein
LRFVASQLTPTRNDLLEEAVGGAAHRRSPFVGIARVSCPDV